MIELDGSYLEGGGQILRTAVGLSAATGQPCRIFNIRKGRSNPGLQAQHLNAVRAVAGLCNARLSGAEIGALELELEPGPLEPPAEVSVHVGTAGAVTLVLQALLIALARAPRPVSGVVTGGTHVKWAPLVEYLQSVTAYYLERMGLKVRVKLKRCGFYPKGGGRVEFQFAPGEMQPLNLTRRSEKLETAVRSVASEQLKKSRVAERQIEAARRVMDFDAEEISYDSTPSAGSSVFVTARFENCVLGASALGELGKPAEEVGRECAYAMRNLLRGEGCLDEHMADQILPFMALAPGDSQVAVADITDHCRTNMWVIEKLLPIRFEVDTERLIIACRHV